MMSVLAQFDKIEPFRLFPREASTIAPEVDKLYLFLILVTVCFCIVIFGAIIFMVVKYKRKHEDEYPEAVPTNLALELTWTILPFLIAMVMFVWGAQLFLKMAHIPENSMEISVTGKQWMWNIQHQTGKREKNELHVPVRRNIKLRMTSEDVIHSFSIPSFRVKHDVVPGRYSEMWFNAKEPGQYYLFCAEYCGAQHSGMVGRVVAMEPKDYEAWLANSVVDEPPQIAGEKLFTYYGCVTCHGQQGPSLAHIYGNKRRVIRDHNIYEVTADDNYLRRSILNPNYEFVEGYNQLMPTFQGVLTEDQVNQLIAYLKSLSDPNSSRPEYRPPDALPPAAGTFVPDRNVASGPRSSVLEPTDGVAPPGAVFPSSQPGPTTAPAK